MPATDLAPEFTWVIIAILATFGTARMLRLFIHDTFPPTAWLREKYLVKFGDTKWGDLATCQFCLGPYFAAINIAFGYFTDFHWTWWVANAIAGLSYVAAIVVSYDQPE